MKDKTITELLKCIREKFKVIIIDDIAESAKLNATDGLLYATEVMERLPLYEEAVEALDLLVKCKDHKEICQGECDFYKNNKPLAWNKAKATIATIKGESQ